MIDLHKLKELAEKATPYCGDNSCKFAREKWAPRGGMATNGGCRCFRDVQDVNFRRLIGVAGPSAILKLIEVIDAQTQALETLSGFEAARFCLSKTKEILESGMKR
jgi:hypothetical protein